MSRDGRTRVRGGLQAVRALLQSGEIWTRGEGRFHWIAYGYRTLLDLVLSPGTACAAPTPSTTSQTERGCSVVLDLFVFFHVC